MSISPSVAYNLQNHGTDYNLVTSGGTPSAGSERVYAWQATNCGSGNLSYLVDALAQKCLFAGPGSSVAVHDCNGGDQAWIVQEDNDSVDTYTLQNVVVGSNAGFLSLYEDKKLNLSSGEDSYARWSFQSESPPANVAWDVCSHISGLNSSALTSATSTQAVTVTTSSPLGALGSGRPGSTQTAEVMSTRSEQRFSAEATVATTGASSSGMAEGLSTPSAVAQMPSGSSVAQSNDAGDMKVASCVFLVALTIGVSVTSL